MEIGHSKVIVRQKIYIQEFREKLLEDFNTITLIKFEHSNYGVSLSVQFCYLTLYITKVPNHMIVNRDDTMRII